MKITVLFVDDEPKVLRGLRRQIGMEVDDWNILLASGGTEALAILQRQSVDVIIADMRMPGMDGISLLAKVARQHPSTVRMILTGHANAIDAMRAANFAHQFLAKPIDAPLLVETVHDTIMLRNMLNSHELRRVVAEIDKLPSMPALYTRLMQALQSPSVKMDDISRIVSEDVAMTTKMLQLVNSAYFGLPRHISNPRQAVIMLGLNTIRNLALTVHVFGEYKDPHLDGFSLVALQQHGLLVAALAKEIARGLMLSDYDVDNAVTAGMLHVLGRLILGCKFTARYKTVLAKAAELDIMLEDIETNILGVSNATIGAYLMGLWGLPMPVVEAVLFHHRPEDAPSATVYPSPLMAVHIAEVLAYQIFPESALGKPTELSPLYQNSALIQSRMPDWVAAARKISGLESQNGH